MIYYMPLVYPAFLSFFFPVFVFFSDISVSSWGRSHIWFIFLSFYELTEVLSQRLYLLNKCLQNWIAGDTIAPLGAIISGSFFFCNTIKRYCQDVVTDSESVSRILLKLKVLIKVNIHSTNSYNTYNAYWQEAIDFYSTCRLFPGGSLFLCFWPVEL